MKRVMAQEVAHVADRMQNSQRQEVRAALKTGAKPIGLYRYYEQGPLVLRVERPASWHGEIHDRFRHLPLSCLIPAECEEATQRWFARQDVA